LSFFCVIIDDIHKEQTNNNYTEPILEEELNSVLKRIKNHKTPGEDGLNGDLFLNMLANYLITDFSNF
jgi:hypothetical protein